MKIVKNKQFGSIEIYFDSKPAKETREALKAKKFRWNGVKKCWYGFGAADFLEATTEATTAAAAAAPETEKAPEAMKAPEPVEGARDFANDIRRGDVVRVSGATGTTAKSVNGLYWVSRVHGDGDYWLESLKRDRGSDLEGIGKRSHSWPLHCYANNPRVCAEFRENIKGVKIEGMGPRSAAVFSLMVRNLEELREGLEESSRWGACYREEQEKRIAEESANIERMKDENPGMEEFAAKLDKKFAPKGPGLAIRADGLEVRNSDGTWKKFNLSMTHDGDAVNISGSYYGRSSSSTIPGGFGFEVTNDSDYMTDYHEADKATVKKGHPLFDTLARIIDAGRGRYELTDADAEAVAAFLKAKKDAEKAAQEAEHAEYIEKCERQEKKAAEIIAEYVELFPGDSYHPHVVVQWSELGAMSEHALESAGELNECGATVFSVEAFENITGDLDDYFKDMQGYFKLKFTYFDGDFEFTDRCDLGEGTGSYGSRMRQALEYIKKHAGDADERVMLDGGAMVTRDEYGSHARRYLEQIPATFDDLNTTDEA